GCHTKRRYSTTAASTKANETANSTSEATGRVTSFFDFVFVVTFSRPSFAVTQVATQARCTYLPKTPYRVHQPIRRPTRYASERSSIPRAGQISTPLCTSHQPAASHCTNSRHSDSLLRPFVLQVIR